MDSEPLRTTATNSAQETHGRVLGLELPLFRWVFWILIAGLAAFAFLQSRRGVGLSAAFWLILLPAILAALWLAVFAQNRHPSFAADVAETALSGGDAAPGAPGASGSNLRAQHPDGYFLDGLLVFNGLGPGGSVAKAFWLDVPDLAHASAPTRNRFDEQVRRLLKVLPETYRVQVLWWVDADYKADLLRFVAQTERFREPACRQARNRTLLHFWESMRRGGLRRQRVALTVGFTLPGKNRVPHGTLAAARHYDEVLAQCRTQLAEFGRQLHALFVAVGGGATPMSEADAFQVILQTLNPSLARRPDNAPLPALDPERSIFANCWHSPIRGRRASRGFWLDEFEHGLLALQTWPVQVYPTLVYRLTQLGFGDYRIAVQLRRLPTERLLARAQRELDHIHQLLAAKPNERLRVTQAKLEERIQRLSRNDRVPFQAEVVLTAWAPTVAALSERMLALKSAFQGLSGATVVEGLPAFSKNGFLKSILGLLWCRHRGPQLYAEDDVLAAMLPLSSSFVGHLGYAHALFPGANGNVVGIRLFSGDGRDAQPLNLLIVGSPGMGKSVVAAYLVLQTAGYFPFVFIIEEGLIWNTQLTRALGGEPILFRLDGRQSLNAFDTQGLPLTPQQQATIVALIVRMVGVPADEDQARYRQALIARQLRQFLAEFADDVWRRMSRNQQRDLLRRARAAEQMATAQDLTLTEAFVRVRQSPPADTDEAALWEFHASHSQLVSDFVFSTLTAAQYPTLSAFKEHLEVNATGPEREACAQLATLLAPYCGEGSPYGALFDRPTNIALDGRIVHFDLSLIAEAAKELRSLIAFLILNHIWQRLLTLPRDQWKLLVLEELARLLSEMPGAEALVAALYSQMRKAGVLIVSILQSIAQVRSPALRTAILGNSPHFFLFNPGDRTDLASLAADIGLPAAAQEAILRYARPAAQAGRPYSEFCYFSPDPHRPICGMVRHVELAPPEAARASNPSDNKPTTVINL